MNDFQTSFIPKKTEVEAPVVRKKGVGIFMLIAVFIFVLAIAGGVGAFLYERVIESSLASKKESLDRAQEAFEPDLIRELARIDKKITASKEVLSQHISPSELFSLLEELTLENISFTDFEYSAGEEGYMIRLGGVAKSFSTLALQSDVFGSNRYIIEPVFEDLDLDRVGNVTFSVSAKIDPGLIDYEGNLPGTF